MNVKQLIESLQKFDPNTLVVVDGYEDGYHTPDVKTITVCGPYPGKPYWDGEYEQYFPEETRYKAVESIQAVYLPRY